MKGRLGALFVSICWFFLDLGRSSQGFAADLVYPVLRNFND